MRIVISITHIIFKERKDGIAITAEGLGDYSNGSVSTLKIQYSALRPQTPKITLVIFIST